MSSKLAKLLHRQKWDFVGDIALQEILTRDYRELRRIVSAGARKSAVVLCGSILEAVLVAKLSAPTAQEDYLRVYSKALDVDNMPSWGLENLINTCRKLGYLDDQAERLAHIVQNFRNLIHPGRARLVSTKVDANMVVAAIALLNHVVQRLSPVVGPSTRITQRERFLRKLQRKFGLGEMEAVRGIIEWAERNEMQHRWTSALTYAPQLRYDGYVYAPLVVGTNGKFAIRFKQFLDKPSIFHYEKHRELLRRRLNEEALGHRIREKRINSNPSFSLRLLADPTVRTNFLAILDWIVASIKQ